MVPSLSILPCWVSLSIYGDYLAVLYYSGEATFEPTAPMLQWVYVVKVSFLLMLLTNVGWVLCSMQSFRIQVPSIV